MHSLRWAYAACLLALLLTQTLHARPIAFKDGTVVIADFRDGAMAEAQLFFAPTQNLSFEAGYMELDDDGTDVSHAVINWLDGVPRLPLTGAYTSSAFPLCCGSGPQRVDDATMFESTDMVAAFTQLVQLL